MRPKRGVQLVAAATRLEQLAMLGNNVASGMIDLAASQNSFVEWVAQLERTYDEFFDDVDMERLHTARYWRIQSLDGATARPYELLRMEIDLQVRRLQSIATLLRREAIKVEYNGPAIAVPDTNVLLHQRLFDEVPWDDVLGVSGVLLAVPIRVVEELDKLKRPRGPLAERAQQVIAHLRGYVESATTAPATLRAGVGIQVVQPLAIDDRRPPVTDADEEVLDTCEALMFTGKRIAVVTGDYAMQIRAAARDVEALGMPEQYRKPLKA